MILEDAYIRQPSEVPSMLNYSMAVAFESSTLYLVEQSVA